MNELLLSVDQGTTNTKAMLVERSGRVVYRTSAPVGLHFPAPGFVEADPDDLWTSVTACLRACVSAAAGRPMAGLAISNQRETALVWERGSLRPLTPAMSWQCRRSSALCAALAPRAERFRSLCGLPLDPLVSAGKWAWAFAHDSSLRERAGRGEVCLGTVDSWLMAKLTAGGVHACDHSNGSRTGLMNLRAAAWDEELLEMFDIPAGALPQLMPSSSRYGSVTALAELGGVPIVCAVGDSHAALAAHRCNERRWRGGPGQGDVRNRFFAHDGGQQPERKRRPPGGDGGVVERGRGSLCVRGQHHDEWVRALEWVGRFLGLNDPLREAPVLAETVTDAGGVVFVPAMAGLAAPWWRTEARGVVLGLEATSSGAHLARAALEAIAFQVRDVFLAMEECTGMLAALHADGGAARNRALMQFQADILGRPVLRGGSEDLSALGAAWLGGLTLGWWDEATPFGGDGAASAQVHATYDG